MCDTDNVQLLDGSFSSTFRVKGGCQRMEEGERERRSRGGAELPPLAPPRVQESQELEAASEEEDSSDTC